MLFEVPVSTRTSRILPTILTEQSVNMDSWEQTARHQNKENISHLFGESVSEDIEDVENEENGVKRNENQVDDTSCYPLIHREGRCLLVLFRFGWKASAWPPLYLRVAKRNIAYPHIITCPTFLSENKVPRVYRQIPRC